MRVLVRLQMSHPKSSSNKGLGERLGKSKTLHWKFVSRCVQPASEKRLHCWCFTSRAQDRGGSGCAAALLSPNSPAKMKATGRNVAPQLNPCQIEDKASVHVMFPHGKSPALIQTLAQACRIPQQQQHHWEHLVWWKQARSPLNIQGPCSWWGHCRAYPCRGSKAYTCPCPPKSKYFM